MLTVYFQSLGKTYSYDYRFESTAAAIYDTLIQSPLNEDIQVERDGQLLSDDEIANLERIPDVEE